MNMTMIIPNVLPPLDLFFLYIHFIKEADIHLESHELSKFQ